MFNFKSLPQALPTPILREFDRLPGLGQNGYGWVFAVKDLYETVLRVICLAVCFLMEQTGEDQFCRVLLSPKQMSFGDWVNALPGELKRSDYVKNHAAVSKYLKKMTAFYNNSGIVKWRNDFLGHGLMSNPEDVSFFVDVENRINDLIDFLNRQSVPAEIQELDFEHMEPFMFQEGGEVYLLESVDRAGTVFYLNQSARRRQVRNSDYFLGKKEKYFASLNVTQEQRVWNQDVHLSEEDRAVDGFHLSAYYKKPDYMTDWLCGCLNRHEKGVFLLQGARGTGKSSFVLACDELNQHGDQKIQLESGEGEAAVRAYYCSRIDFSNINDFKEHIQDVLNTFADGETIRSRAGSLPVPGKNLAEAMDFYRQQYERYKGKEKLVLFLDGIDELTERGWEILNLLPEDGTLKEGSYLVLTCRSEEEEVSPVIQDFLGNFRFTERVCFALDKEAHRFLQKILEEKWNLSGGDSEIFADKFDNRLTVLPLLWNLSEQELRDLTVPDLDAVIRVNLEKLRLCYGEDYFREFTNFLLWIGEAPEGLTLNEISMLAFHHDTALREICFLKDASPFLTEFRSYRGNLFVLSRTEHLRLFRTLYQETFREELKQWRSRLFEINDSGENTLVTESCRDALLFLSAHFGELQYSYGLDQDPWTEEDICRLLRNISRVCHSVGMGDQVHRLRNALRGLIGIDMTLEALIKKGRTEPDTLLFFMETASDSLQLAVILRDMRYASELIESRNIFLEERRETFDERDPRIRLSLSRFYSDSMTYFCEIYDGEKVQKYFDLAMRLLDDKSSFPGYEEEYEKNLDVLQHNYLGALRNQAPERILSMAESFLKKLVGQPLSFSKISNLLMVAMCYKSAGHLERSEEQLMEARDAMEDFLQERGVAFRQLSDPHDQEIYIAIYYRLAQCVCEKAGMNPEAVTFAEIKAAMKTLDFLIEYMLQASKRGFGYFDFFRLDLMTTASLLRNAMAFKLAFWESRRGIRLSETGLPGAGHYRKEALTGAGIVEQSYECLEKVKISYNKINAMSNLMNCAAIHAGFGDFAGGVALLDKTIQRYQPENEQEEKVYQQLCRKRQEFMGRF